MPSTKPPNMQPPNLARVVGTLDFSSWFYRNCKVQRRRRSKCCDSCPFRTGIEAAEIDYLEKS